MPPRSQRSDRGTIRDYKYEIYGEERPLDARTDQVIHEARQRVLEVKGPELTIVVPTFKERDNVVELVRRVDFCLDGTSWEIIFVDDDSPDSTADLIREVARRDARVRCIQRIGRRGLSSACVEGMLASSAPYLAVMDGDLQHDEALLPRMLATLKNEGTDIVIASRYVEGGGLGHWDESRAAISRFATRLSRLVVRADLTDPMSGFFMITREAFYRRVRGLSCIGFKILVDIFASSPKPPIFKELPYQFRVRHAGESKLDTHVAWDYIMLLLDKLVGQVVPVRFVAFAFVGGLGVIVHLLVVAALFQMLDISFVASQAAATLVAMTFNFAVNNLLTYSDMRLRGWGSLRGWVTFVLACSVGALANVGIASALFEMRAGWIVAAIAGVLVGAVWNYSVSMVYTWKKPKYTGS
jgi:dolichol-phosphate mannosyltransferase